MQTSKHMDMYYTKVIFIGDEYNREYEYTTDMKYEPGSLVKENRTNLGDQYECLLFYWQVGQYTRIAGN